MAERSDLAIGHQLLGTAETGVALEWSSVLSEVASRMVASGLTLSSSGVWSDHASVLNVRADAYGAVGDGDPEAGTGTDDTAAVQAALSAASPGMVVMFPSSSGSYRVTSTLTVPKGVTVRGEGGRIWRDFSSSVGYATMNGLGDNRIVGLEFDGGYRTRLPETADRVGYADLTLSPTVADQDTVGFDVTGCVFRYSCGSSIVTTRGRSVAIHGNRFFDWFDHAIYLGATSTAGDHTHSVVISGNTLYATSATTVYAAIKARAQCDNLTIVGNSASHPLAWFVELAGIDTNTVGDGTNVTITGNTVTCTSALVSSVPSTVTAYAFRRVVVSGNAWTCSSGAIRALSTTAGTAMLDLLVVGNAIQQGGISYLGGQTGTLGTTAVVRGNDLISTVSPFLVCHGLVTSLVVQGNRCRCTATYVSSNSVVEFKYLDTIAPPAAIEVMFQGNVLLDTFATLWFFNTDTYTTALPAAVWADGNICRSAASNTQYVVRTTGSAGASQIGVFTPGDNGATLWEWPTTKVGGYGQITWDPAELANGSSVASAAVTVPGVTQAGGVSVVVSPPVPLQGLSATASVTGTDEVTIVLSNLTGGPVNLASGVWRVRAVWR